MKALSSYSLVLAAVSLMAAQPGCSSTQSGGGSGGKTGTGGSPSSGGSSGNGGTTGVGGSIGSGGASSGGAAGNKDAAAGGASGSGGSVASGGSFVSGGTPGGGGVSTGGSVTGGAGGSGPDAAQGSGGKTSDTGGAGPGSGGAPATGGSTGLGGNGTGGSAGAGGAAGGTTGGVDGGTSEVIACPDLPGAPKSPLYTITANGTPLFVEKMTNFAAEMNVHYAHASLSGAGPATIAVTVSESFSAYKLSPKSRQLSATKNGNTVTYQGERTGPGSGKAHPQARNWKPHYGDDFDLFGDHPHPGGHGGGRR